MRGSTVVCTPSHSVYIHTDLDNVEAELHHVLIAGTVVPRSSVHLQSIAVCTSKPMLINKPRAKHTVLLT